MRLPLFILHSTYYKHREAKHSLLNKTRKKKQQFFNGVLNLIYKETNWFISLFLQLIKKLKYNAPLP
jgi:lipopolysaccharide biosynthesis regulator YciM